MATIVFAAFAAFVAVRHRSSMGRSRSLVLPRGEQKQGPTLSSNESINSSLKNILQSQAAVSLTGIDCGKISPKQFVDLGDAVMGALAGNEKHHTAMETMMGGEDAPKTEAMHASMGATYLGCPPAAMKSGGMKGMDMGEGEMGGMSGMHFLMMKRNPILGEYLADSRGLTLYTFAKDTSEMSLCEGSCPMLWPPYNIPMKSQNLSLLYRHLRTFGRRDASANRMERIALIFLHIRRT